MNALFSRFYNPSEELTNEEQVVAARWELLRRNDTFRGLARQWTESRKFRLAHAETPEYHNQKIHFPRCALDWMITPSERVEVLRAQLARNRVFTDARYNFGPIICTPLFSGLEVCRRKGRDCFRAQPRRSNVLLSPDDNWRDATDPFKKQFRFAVLGDVRFQESPADWRRLGNDLRRAAHRLASGPNEATVKNIAERLFEAGEWFVELGEFYRIFAFPNSTYTPAGLQQHFDKIRASFVKANQYDPRARYNVHKSYLGTRDEWRWYLTAEQRGLDWRKPGDRYELARIYSEHLKSLFGRRRPNVKVRGHTGEPVESRQLKNRRKTVRRHCEAIQNWIEKQYPPQV